MIPDSLDFVLRPVADEQAEYAAAQTKLPAAPSPAAGGISETAVRTGSQAAVSVPRWAPVDDSTADLLTLAAEEHPATPQEAHEWDHFIGVLREVARTTGHIDQNVVRPWLRGEIKPQRIGAFYNRAAKAGLIRASLDHTISNDKHGRNTGKPARVWRWLGT
ncbi:MAG: hypothetical protein ACRDPS_22185 [Nocardioides sp.]|uniref:hypothetical protein n=1 Tax=Nocardioides sp. TaxID=35761 RepID=UPI003D6ADF69